MKNRMNLQRALLLSTALSAGFSATARAGDVEVATSQTAAAVQADINAAIIADSDLNLTVTSAGAITGGSISLTPATGQGDGAITFVNNGQLGAVDANGNVTDNVGATFNGRPAAGASNSFTGTNAGLVSGGLRAVNFGGNVGITNTGTVYNGIQASGLGTVDVTNSGTVNGGVDASGDGNVTVSSSANGVVRSGNVTATSNNVVAAPTVVDGFTVTDTSSGTAVIDQQGDVANQTDTVRGNVSAEALNGASVTIGGKAGDVSAEAGGVIQTVSGAPAPVVVGTVSTSTTRNDVTRGGGVASVAILGNGDVNSVAADSIGGATASIDGEVANNVSVSADGISSTLTTVNVNDPGVSGSFTQTYVESLAGKTAVVTIGQSGEVGGDVIANGNGGVTLSNAGVIEGDVLGLSRRTLSKTEFNPSGSTTATATLNETVSQFRSSSSLEEAGGAASFTNASGARVEGDVEITAVGDVTIGNSGVVYGHTFAESDGSISSGESMSKTTTSTVIATAVTTTTVENSSSSSSASVGGNVNGTYAGTNGTLNFGTGSDGSIYQSADKASTATVTGVVYGELESEAGSDNSESASASTIVTVLSGGNGTRNTDTSSSNTTTTNAGGDSSVTVSGKLARGDAGVTPNLRSEARGNSTVAISGSVAGNVSSEAYSQDRLYEVSGSTVETITGGVARIDSQTSSSSDAYTATGGSASVALTGTGTAASEQGDVSAYGRTGASVTVAKGAKVGGNSNFASVYANASGSDTLNTTESSFTRDPVAKTGTRNVTATSNSTVNAGVGNATVTIAGAVTGDVESYSARGNATTTITGTVGDDARAYAQGANYTNSTSTDYAGDVADNSTSLTIAKQVETSTQTQVGGTASVIVDTDTALKNANAYGVADDVDAYGFTAASVTIANGSKIGGGIESSSNATNYSRQITRLYDENGVQTDQTQTESTTLAGGDASATVGVKSLVEGSVFVSGDKSATVANAGAILGSVTADALGENESYSLAITNLNNVALREDVTTVTYTGVGGTASVSNAAGATIEGSVSIAAGTGIVTNAGGIAGSIVAGQSVANYTTTQADTITDTVQTVTPAAALTSQTYTINQNNFLGGGIYVGGATVSDPFGRTDEPDLRTSNIAATINLNNGSVTLGDIEAQRDEDGNRLTSTTLNLNGSGYLGADKLNLKTPTSADFAPEAVLSTEAQDLGFGAFSTNAVRILGVETVNKADAGTFVLDLAGYEAPAAPGLLPTWSADVGAINVTAGELQLTGPAYDPTDADSDYVGIKGNINVNGGTLVVGRRTLVGVDTLGHSLTTEGTETITGIKLAVTGDYTQTATGTTVVGVSPALVRAGPVSVGTSNGGTEVLGPIQAGANVPYFTTAANGASVQSSPSRVDVTGKLTLAGKLVVDVTRDAIYSNGDGYTLFSYTDAGSAVSATVSQSIASPFVSFELKNDAAAKTVSIAAKRTSYASVATNPNAASAAGALDALIPIITQKITQDANGGAVFTSVSQLGLAQDAANIISGLDWRLTLAGAQQVFNELSSAEIYASLAAIEQNSALTESFESAAVVGATGKSGVGFWINPVGRFARYGGVKSGASKIRDNSYGGAFGFNLGYSDEGTLGIGFAYAEHDIAARGTPESAKARTYSLGLDWKHSFGPLQAGAQFVYGFSDFDVTRQLTLLDRTTSASFKGREWDANAEVGYDVMAGSTASVMPYAKLALRHWSLGGFTEEGGAGIGVSSGRDSKTVFVPEVGVRLATTLAATEALAIRPFGKVSYTFQGDIGSSRAFTYAAGGTPFILNGVDPKGFGSVDAGINALFHDRIGLFVQTGVNFGGSQKGAEARGGINVRF